MSRVLRLAAAGFQHETNSFAARPADLSSFERDDSWPGLRRGSDVPTALAGLNIPLAGFLSAAGDDPEVEILPVLWASAEPCGPVTTQAFERIAGMILHELREAAPLDGLYLDLHGAMIAEGHLDGEGEILRRVRAEIGPDLPIVASLDLHANVSPTMAALATRLAIFRTYPHLDMAATGARCVALLKRLAGRPPPATALRHPLFLIPLHAQFTGAEPARGLYAALPEDGVELALGFPFADTPFAGPSVVAHAEDAGRAEAIAREWCRRVEAAEGAFAAHVPLPAREAVRAALRAPPGRPAVIADVQDNPGGGGSADTTGLLRALVEEGATGCVLALVCDAEAAARSHRTGEGGRFEAALGGRSGWPGDAPFPGRFEVERLSNGPCRYVGAMYGGGHAEIGPSALLRLDRPGTDIRVIVTTIPNQALDRGYLIHFGVVPEAQRIVALKSTVHYRDDFAGIAGLVVEAAAPGCLPTDPSNLPSGHLRPGVRRSPRRDS